MRNVFEYTPNFTREKVIIKWKEQSVDSSRQRFNAGWLKKNGYKGLYTWATKTYEKGIQELVSKSSSEIQSIFSFMEKKN